MTWEMILVMALLVFALASFVWEKIPTDVTAILAFSILIVASYFPIENNLPKVDQLIGVFSSQAPLAIAALFILSAALEKCGVIEGLAKGIMGLTRFGYIPVFIGLCLGVGAMSAFVNNTPVVVIFMPVVLMLSRKLGVAPSKLLIPLSYASIFGGVCTLVGTSTNILASDIIKANGQAPLTMFEIGKVGIILFVIGLIYLVFIGSRLLPNRESLTSILSEEERKEFFTEAFVRHGSELIGKSVKDSGLLSSSGVRVLEIIRNEVALKTELNHVVMEAGDRLILACRPSGIAKAKTVEGLRFGFEETDGLETISAHEGSIVEGVIAPRSSIVGKNIQELNFRQRFRMIIIAIHRRGINLRNKIDTIPLEYGDTLLMMGTDQAREEIRRGDDILLLDSPPTPAQDMRKKAPLVIAIMTSMIALVSLNLIPIAGAAIVGVALVFLFKILKPKEGYQAIDWSILFLIYGMLGLGQAMEKTGLSNQIAGSLLTLTKLGIPENILPFVILAILYLSTSILTEILSNNATVVLMTPIALTIAHFTGFDPRPFIIATCIASSASFSTPIGYQTNTYVYSVGGYKFADFLKVGIPLNLIYFTGSVILVPIIWPF